MRNIEYKPIRALGKLLANSLFRYFIVAGGVALFYLSLVALGIGIGFHYFLSILFSQLIAIMVGFPLYRRFVFESKDKVHLDFIRFISVWASGAIAGLVLTPALVEFFAWDPLVSQILAIITISVLSYLAHKLFTFRNK